MGLSDFYRILRRRWLIVAGVTLICLVAAAGFASTVPTTYTSSTRLYVSMATGTSVNDAYQGGLAAQQRITSYSYIASGAAVAERVVDDLGLTVSPDEVQRKVSASFPPATTLLDISVTDSTPEGARLLADRVAAQFRRLVSELETTVVGAAPAAQATVIDPATTPTAANGPDVVRLLAIGLFGGLALGCLAALAWDRLERKVRRPEQLDEVLGVPVLASVPGHEPDATNAIARLRAWLTSARGGPNPTTVMLTSFSGRSAPSVAVRLSTALAHSGRRVAVVDANTSGVGVSASLGMLADPGVAEWLRTPHSSLDELLRFSEDGVGVVPLGAADERTSDLLGSERFAELVSDLKARFDYILVDTAPTPADAGVLTLSSRCDCTLAIVELGTSSLPRVRAAVACFEEFSSGLIGVVAVTAPSRGEQRRGRRDERASADVRRSLVPSS